MSSIWIFVLALCLPCIHPVQGQPIEIHIIQQLFEDINRDVVEFNRRAAKITWEASVDPKNLELPEIVADYQYNRILWQEQTCDQLLALHQNRMLNVYQERQTYLLCRGPMYTFAEARNSSTLYDELQSTYSDVNICIPSATSVKKGDVFQAESAILAYISSVEQYLGQESSSVKDLILFSAKMATSGVAVSREPFLYCLRGEADINKLTTLSRNEVVLRFIWLSWREKVGASMKKPYKELVDLENTASKRNGYSDIGAAWRDELEIPGLKKLCRQLYSNVRPLYYLLHGVVRFYLRKVYGDHVPEKGPIPAHLLGNLWAQNWEPLANLIIPNDINIDERIKQKKWTVTYMVQRADDFYQSLGLPEMTDTFWRRSVLKRNEELVTRCHGTAADMFQYGDFRLLYCAETTSEDFYVIHHELGHIQYYMAYYNLPGIFRQGTNSAFHESIGDAIMLGVTAPLHLHRLGLINDTVLYDRPLTNEDHELSQDGHKLSQDDHQLSQDSHEIGNKDDRVLFSAHDILLLKQALNKIPQIPFALLIDEYRWKYFENSLKNDSFNKQFWDMALELQGITPPGERGEEYFDVGAKYHVPDNTPYIRYFLSNFLQHQIFEVLCKAAVYGRKDVDEEMPDSIIMHKCDIYGSKTAGKILRDIMSRGSSQHWKEVMQETLGQEEITADALLRHYQPAYKLLKKIVQANNIPIGW